jgi:hypothetical protein
MPRRVVSVQRESTGRWGGLGVVRSPGAERWTRQPHNILREPGRRSGDGAKGGHACILVQGEDAWIFYFTHPQRGPGMAAPPPVAAGVEPCAMRRTAIQVAKLALVGGETTCRRDEPWPFRLQRGIDNWPKQAAGQRLLRLGRPASSPTPRGGPRSRWPNSRSWAVRRRAAATSRGRSACSPA